MVNSIIADIEESVFNNDLLTRNVLLNHYTTETNAFGEKTQVFSNQDTIKAVVLDYKKFRKEYDSYGSYKGSKFILLISQSVDISEEDDIEFGSNSYFIQGIEQPLLGETAVINRVFISEVTK